MAIYIYLQQSYHTKISLRIVDMLVVTPTFTKGKIVERREDVR